MKHKIVFLDASTVDFGDIDLSIFTRHGNFASFPRTSKHETIERIKDATIVITNKVILNREIFSKAGSLRYIAVAATGYNNIDIDAARQFGIAVSNVAGYSTPSVAQFTMLFILALASRLIEYNAAAHSGRWSASPIFTLGNWPTVEIAGKTLGILGYGAIGREVARIATAFGMKVIALKRDGIAYSDEVPRMELFQLASVADFISVHLPLTAENRYFISDDFFSAMKPSGFFINMARGALVNPAALYRALVNGTIAGAAIDVMEQEPPHADDPLLTAPNLIITPHIAWATKESRQRLINEIDANIESFIRGVPRNLVT
ncbi:MAG: D-2-hydroxyacid dehydrogenase [Spirochaetes bacterium]|nr:D-2-hydroxyacid dehydrogenase [Spirochaetota bacterium]